jgi:hypothetical protein
METEMAHYITIAPSHCGKIHKVARRGVGRCYHEVCQTTSQHDAERIAEALSRLDDHKYKDYLRAVNQ